MSRIRENIKNRPALSLFLLALIIRLFALAFNPASWQEPLIKDSELYQELAVGMISGSGFSIDGRPTARVTPVYPLFLAGVYSVFGLNRPAVLILQALLGALLVFYIYRLGGQVFSRRVAAIAAGAAVVYWPFIAAGMKLLSEALFIPLLAATGYYTVLALKHRRPGPAATAAVITALTILTRPIILYFSAVVFFVLAWDFFRHKNKRALSVSLLYLGILVLIHIPWIARNYRVFGHFIPTNTASGAVLYAGNLPREGKKFGYSLRKHELEPCRQYVFDLPEVEQSKALTEMALEGLKSQPPAGIAKLFLLKFLFFWMPFDWEVLGNRAGIFNTWFFWVGIFSLYWLRHLKWREEYFYPVALVAYFSLICLVAYGSPRMRLPVESFMLLFAASGWHTLESRASGRTVYIFGMIILLSLVGGYYYGEQIKEAGRVLAIWLKLW